MLTQEEHYQQLKKINQENPGIIDQTNFEIKFKNLVADDVIDLSIEVKKQIDQFGYGIKNRSIGELRLLQHNLQNLVGIYNYISKKSEN